MLPDSYKTNCKNVKCAISRKHSGHCQTSGLLKHYQSLWSTKELGRFSLHTQPSGLATDRPPCSRFRWQDYWAVTATAGRSGDWGVWGTWSVGGRLRPAACSRMSAWGATAHNEASQHPDRNTQRTRRTERGCKRRNRSIVVTAQMSRLRV